MSDRGLGGQSRSAIRAGAGTQGPRHRWLRAVFGLLSPAGSRSRLTILIFHRVHEHPDVLFPTAMDAAAFRERLLWVRSWFNVLPLDEAVSALSKGTLPARAMAITFDDGYADNCTVALPILRQLNLHATFFISTAFIDGGAMFNDVVIEAIRRTTAYKLDLSVMGLGVHALDSPAARRAAIGAILQQVRYLPLALRHERTDAIASVAGIDPPADLMMTSNQIRALAAAGMGIGGHTVRHPILTAIDDELARKEIAGGRDTLEGLLRQPVKLFAYPNGRPGTDYAAPHVKIVRDLGFTAAVSTAPGAACAGDSLLELPRFTPWGRTRARWGWRLARNLGTRIERAAA